MCTSKASLTGKTAIITGANAGIGLETAVGLAERGARVILACRDVERGERAAVEVRKRSGNDNVVFVQLDLASLQSVRAFAEQILREEKHIDILINNAGIFSRSFRKTKDGFESMFGVNHLGHFLLTNLLLERIKESPAARIVNVSSLGSLYGKMDLDKLNSPTLESKYDTRNRYNTSKLANVMFTKSLARKLQGTGILVNSLHPGIILRTSIARDYSNILVS